MSVSVPRGEEASEPWDALGNWRHHHGPGHPGEAK